MLRIEDLWSEMPLAVLIGGPHNGKLVSVTGPYEVRLEGNSEYRVVPRGEDDWKFPIHYRYASEVGA